MRRIPVVVSLLAMVAGAACQAGPRPIVPPDLYAVVGHEMNVYFDNAVLTPPRSDVFFDVECAKGRQDEERWRFTPVAEDVGDHPFGLRLLDAESRPIAETQATLHVVSPDAGADRSISLMCVGDSLTHASVYPHELFDLFGTEGSTELTMVGTHHPVESLPPEVVHEGYGGWTWEAFCARWTEGTDARARSPFLRLEGEQPVLDFQSYCDANNGGVGPDFITVLLGCNDTFSATEDQIEERIDRMFGFADMLLGEFHRVRRDTQIGLLLLVPPAASQDAFGSNYACGQTRWQYRRNQHRVVDRMMETYGGREGDSIWLLPAHLNLDTVLNYPTRAEPANARNETEVARQSNGVHPSAEGYRQIADTIYAWLRWRLSQ